MTLGLLFLIVAIVLFVLSAIPFPSRINLFNLAWAFVVAAWAFGGVTVIR